MSETPVVPTKSWPRVPKLQMPSALNTPSQYQWNYGTHQRPPSTAGSIHSNPLYVPIYPPATPGVNNNSSNVKNNPYYNPFVNPGKASEFMFKQFEGFKDFTMNTAKSGLSVGEKSAFWMYNKISTWSKKWFTHIFLFVVILLYTAAGAAMFVAIEGVHENNVAKDTRREKNEFVREFREIMRHNITLIEDPQQWEGEVSNWMGRFENQMLKWIENDAMKDKTVWTFMNAVFYCGTIYTTIGG